jgi:WD40 repeat protein
LTPPIPNWDGLKEIAFSADGTRLAGLYGQRDLRVWDFRTGQQLASFHPVKKDAAWLNFGFSPNGQFLLAEGYPGLVPERTSVTVWNLRTGQEWASIDTDLASLTWADHGQRLITWRKDIGRDLTFLHVCSMDAKRGRLIKTQEQMLPGTVVAMSPDGHRWACTMAYPEEGRSAVIEVGDCETGRILHCFTHPQKVVQVQSLGFSPNGKWLLARATQINQEAATTVWDISKQYVQKLGAFLPEPTFSPDDRWLALSTDYPALLLYGTEPLQRRHRLVMDSDGSPLSATVLAPVQLRFSPSGSIVSVEGLGLLSKRHRFVEWIATHVYRLRLKPTYSVVGFWDLDGGQSLASVEGAVRADFARDGKTVVTTHEVGDMKFWDLPFHKPLGQVVGLALVAWSVSLLAGWVIYKWTKRPREHGTSQGVSP